MEIDEDIFKIDYKKSLHNGGCWPQIAACLIYGINPYEERIIRRDPNDYRIVHIMLKEVQELSNLICKAHGGLPWWYYQHLSIFCHIEKLIKIRAFENDREKLFQLTPLFKEIKGYFDFLLEEQKKKFLYDYPYLLRELKLSSLLFINANVETQTDTENKTIRDLSSPTPGVEENNSDIAFDKTLYPISELGKKGVKARWEKDTKRTQAKQCSIERANDLIHQHKEDNLILTITELLKLISQYLAGKKLVNKDGNSYSPKTIRNWINPIIPEEMKKSGAPRKTNP